MVDVNISQTSVVGWGLYRALASREDRGRKNTVPLPLPSHTVFAAESKKVRTPASQATFIGRPFSQEVLLCGMASLSTAVACY